MHEYMREKYKLRERKKSEREKEKVRDSLSGISELSVWENRRPIRVTNYNIHLKLSLFP